MKWFDNDGFVIAMNVYNVKFPVSERPITRILSFTLCTITTTYPFVIIYLSSLKALFPGLLLYGERALKK